MKNEFGLFSDENKFYRSKVEFICCLKVCMGLQNIVNYHAPLSDIIINTHELFRPEKEVEEYYAAEENESIIQFLKENESKINEEYNEYEEEEIIQIGENEELYPNEEEITQEEIEINGGEDNEIINEEVIQDESDNVVEIDESINEDISVMEPPKKRRRWSIERKYLISTPKRSPGKRRSRRNRFFKC